MLKKYYWAISPVLDAVNMVILLIVASFMSDSPLLLSIVALTYMLTPILETECLTLSSRQLGNLLLTLEAICLFNYIGTGSPLALIASIIFSALIPMAHKMTMQFLIFFDSVLSLTLLRIEPVAVLALSLLLDFLIFRGYFIKLMKGHYDIVTFWGKNWKHLWAHQVYDSPIYDKNKKRKREKGFKDMLLTGKARPFYFLLVGLFGKSGNPFILLPLLFISTNFFEIWALSAFILMIIVIFVPQLRMFGEGHKYMRMASFPSSILLIWAISYPKALALFIFMVAFSSYRIYSVYKAGKEGPSPELLEMLDYIKDNEIDYIMCLDAGISDAVAYHCRRRVLWGTHHDCFNSKVIEFFPVLRRPLEWFARKYEIKFVLVDTRYVDPIDVSLKDLVHKSGRYELYRMVQE